LGIAHQRPFPKSLSIDLTAFPWRPIRSALRGRQGVFFYSEGEGRPRAKTPFGLCGISPANPEAVA
jgi:hypothetical protein